MLGEVSGEEADAGITIILKRPTHQDLASMVGTTRETISRVFTELKKQGDIASSGRKLVIREASLRNYLDTLTSNLH